MVNPIIIDQYYNTHVHVQFIQFSSVQYCVVLKLSFSSLIFVCVSINNTAANMLPIDDSFQH